VRILQLTDDGQVSIGTKRQRMLEAATAAYVSFVDDDDLVSPGYCARVLEVLGGTRPPDVVGFRLRHFVDGRLEGYAIHSYSAKTLPPPVGAVEWWNRHDRDPNHLNPVRRVLALRAGYRDMRFGEDADYAERLAKLNPREVFIDAPLYDYLDRPSKTYQHWKE
jgi:hypothetical protein